MSAGGRLAEANLLGRGPRVPELNAGFRRQGVDLGVGPRGRVVRGCFEGCTSFVVVKENARFDVLEDARQRRARTDGSGLPTRVDGAEA